MRGILLVVVLLLAGCASPSEAPPKERGPPDATNEGEQLLEENGFYLPSFGAPSPLHLRLTFTVAEGRAIDVFVAPRASCQAWGTRQFEPTASALDVVNGTLETNVSAGDHCLAFDNAGFAFGKATPTGPATVRFKAELWEIR